MLRAIAPLRMRQIEEAYMKASGTPGIVLMERAALAVVDALVDMTEGGAVFLCGPGNNGGDGYAAARLFARQGRKVVVWALSDPKRLTGDARTNWERCLNEGIPVQQLSKMPQAIPEGISALVDALFGTGLDRALEGIFAEAVRWMNGCGLPVLAVDMPSGTDALMTAATRTVTFHQMKLSQLFLPGRVCSGDVVVADIGIPQSDGDDDFEVLVPADVQVLLPPRPLDAHKGTAGHALLVAGSYGMAGAAALCAQGAMRAGAGLATIACPMEILAVLQTLTPCAMCIPSSELAPHMLLGKSAIAAGPGLGMGDAVSPVLEMLLQSGAPQVWDADALNWLAAHPQMLDDRFILTPHPGEASRLLGIETALIVQDPIAAAKALHARYGAVVLLKGPTTVIVGPSRCALNVYGSPGLATGGSGDVLTGIISGLLAQGLMPFDAARLGALLHGMAGIAAAKQYGVRSMTAQDLVDSIVVS